MMFFIIMNTYTAVMANSILEFNQKKGIAVLSDPSVVEDLTIYQETIEEILNLSNMWASIIRLDKIDFNESKILPGLFQLFFLKRFVISRKAFFEDLLNLYDVDEAVISNIDVYNEIPLLTVLNKKKISLSLFDETVYRGYLSDIFSEVKQNYTYLIKMKSYIKLIVARIILGSYSDILYNKVPFSEKQSFHNYYSQFPDIYPLKNVTNKIKIIPSFPKIESNASSLLLTSCLSEDGLISLSEELELIRQISKVIPSNTVVRFHPRDSQDKKNLILELTGYKELPVNPLLSESLIFGENLLFLSGYLTSTLFTASRLNKRLNVNSFIGLLSPEILNISSLKRISRDFVEINFHGLY